MSWSATDVTAEEGSDKDYEGSSGSVTISAGSTEAVIPFASLKVLNDVIYEGSTDESFLVEVSVPSVTSSGALRTTSDEKATATVLIVDDESSSSASFVSGSSSVDEGDTATVGIELSPVSSASTDVIWSVSGLGSPTLELSSRTLTFGAGESVKSVSFSSVQTADSLYNGGTDRVWSLAITSPLGGSRTSHSLTLTDVQSEPTVSFSESSSSVGEGNTATIGVELSGASSVDRTAVWSFESGDGFPILDVSARTLRFAAGSTSAEISLSVSDDSIYRGDRVWVLDFESTTPSSGVTTHSLTVSDEESDKAEASFAVSDRSVSVDEGDPAAFDVVLSRALESGEKPSEVSFSVAGITASSSDYGTPIPLSSVSFSVGDSTTATITIPTIEDSLSEGDETFSVTLDSATGSVSASSVSSAKTATGTIVDDDDAPRASVSGSDSEVEEGSSVTITVSLDRALLSGETATVFPLTLSGTSSSSDYTLVDSEGSSATSVSFPSDGLTNEVALTLSATSDSVSDGGETVIISLGSPSSGTAELSATVSERSVTTTLYDSALSPVPTVSSGVTSVRVTSSAVLGSGEKIGYSCDPSCGGSRFTSASSFDVDGLSAGTAVKIRLWRASSADSRLSSVSEVSATTLSAIEAFVSDADNLISVDESGGSAAFEIGLSRSPLAGNSVVVSYASSDGTATSPSDFTSVDGSVTFSSGETSKTISVAIIDDVSSEGDESFTVSLSSALASRTGSVALDVAEVDASDKTLTFTITDDDLPQVSWDETAMTLTEAG